MILTIGAGAIDARAIPRATQPAATLPTEDPTPVDLWLPPLALTSGYRPGPRKERDPEREAKAEAKRARKAAKRRGGR